MVAKLTGQRFGRLTAIAPAGRTPAGRVQTAAQWAEELNVNRQTIIHRHKNGRSLVR